MIFGIAVCFTKLSILLLILRIFISSRRDFFFWAVHFLIWVNIIYWITWFFLLIFLCLPRTKIWNPETPGHCLGKFALYRSSAVFNMITDIMMLAIPLYKIFHLQMSMKRKIGISAVFATGFLYVYPSHLLEAVLISRRACISSIIRLAYDVNYSHSEDTTYNQPRATLWG